MLAAHHSELFERKIFSFILFCISLFAAHVSFSQDTSYRYYPELTRYATINDPDSLTPIDTSIGNFQRFNPAEKEFGMLHNGYLGGPSTYKYLRPSLSADIDVGFHAFDKYWRSIEDVKFYNTKQPYTSFYYQQGAKAELVVKIDHSQNINENISLGINFTRMRTDGWYQRQNARASNFNAFLHFKTNNNRYHNVIAYVLNDLKVEENGGIINTSIFSDSVLFDKTIADINLDSAKNTWRNDEIMMLNVFHFGKKITVGKDSDAVEKIIPRVRLQERFEWEGRAFRFYDIENDGDYYVADTLEWNHVRDTFRYDRIMNEVRLLKLNRDSSKSIFNWQGNVFLRHQIFMIQNLNSDENIHAAILGGELRLALSSAFTLSPSLEYNFAGRNSGDYHFGAVLNFLAGKSVSLNLDADIASIHPSLIENNYQSAYYNWNNNFQSEKISSAGFSLGEKKWGFIFKAKVISQSNFIYWNQNRMPVQLAGNLSGYQFFLQKNFQLKHFHFDNEVLYQSYNIDSVVSFPPLVIRSGVYYQNMIFKKAMLGKVGADVNYTSGYYYPGYIGETGQFTVQHSSDDKFNPTIDAFVSVRVRAVRAFVMFQNVFNTGSFSAFPYPMPDRSFKVGFEWMFWD